MLWFCLNQTDEKSLKGGRNETEIFYLILILFGFYPKFRHQNEMKTFHLCDKYTVISLTYLSALCCPVYLTMRGTVCVGCRSLRPGRHIEDDNIVPELAHIHPRERPDWEETISAMVRRAIILYILSSSNSSVNQSDTPYFIKTKQ